MNMAQKNARPKNRNNKQREIEKTTSRKYRTS